MISTEIAKDVKQLRESVIELAELQISTSSHLVDLTGTVLRLQVACIGLVLILAVLAFEVWQ